MPRTAVVTVYCIASGQRSGDSRASHAAHAEVVAVLFPERSQLEDFERSGTTYRFAETLFEEMQIPTISGTSAFGGTRQHSAAELEEIFLKGITCTIRRKGTNNSPRRSRAPSLRP